MGSGLTLGLASVVVAAQENSCDEAVKSVSVVLVHGAGHGGWCWRDTASRLRDLGYRVFTPTLTGLGERVHLRSPEVTLDTHIDDVINLIRAEELDEIVLVGHSYGGTVITGVCDRVKDRIRLVVFLDANTPGDGEATIPNLNPELVEKMTGEPLLDGYLLPVMEPKILGIDPADVATSKWVRRQLSEQPIQTVTQKIKLQNGGSEGLPRCFILTTPSQFLRDWQREKLEEIRADSSWDYSEWLVGHDAMIISPCETAELLHKKIERQGRV
ncbi:MAG: alpha/beta fold hydrolase [Gammaproteobacteria bacterium]